MTFEWVPTATPTDLHSTDHVCNNNPTTHTGTTVGTSICTRILRLSMRSPSRPDTDIR